ncbi:unnamed protein product [Cuscuta campestris]|uniref:Uncharacterized protein n=1 Tax=Cuscuta campestris TaxID=132261 RepID=A0A484KKG8_9ASTE|nr:unnamed protein product [Cuscuta campestris]
MKEEDMVYRIKAAIQKNVSMISMSLAQSLSFMCDWSSGDFHVKNIASLQALRADIVTVVESLNAFQGNQWKKLRMDEILEILLALCTVITDNHSGDFVIRKGSIDNESASSLLFVLYFSKEQSAIISNRVDKEYVA